MKRALVTMATGLLVATLVPIASNASDSVPRQTRASSCASEDAPSVEVVLLVDQSRSLKAPALEAIRLAVDQVGNRLLVPVRAGLDVKFGVAKFGETASTVRELSSLKKFGESFEELGALLSDETSLENFTDYVQGLEEAIGLFDSGDPQACKVLLWFTDGVFDLPPIDFDRSTKGEREAESADLISAVCGVDRPIARRIGSRGIVTFAVLLKEMDEPKWNDWYEKYANLGAGLSSMQAIAGDDRIDKLPIDNYQANETCKPFFGENSDLGGEVLVGSGRLAGILATRLCDAFNCNKVVCPAIVKVGSSGVFPDDGMPPGVMLEDVYVTALAGEIKSVEAVFPDGRKPKLLYPSPVDNRLDPKKLRELPGGWKLKIASAGEVPLEVCIQTDEPRLEAGTVLVSPSPVEVQFGAGTQIQLTVDWAPWLNEVDPAGVIDSWVLSGDQLDVAPQTLGSPDSVVVVTVAELGGGGGDAFELDSVELVVTPQGSEQRVVIPGRIQPPILVRTDKDRPRLECSDKGEHGFGYLKIGGTGEEVVENKLYESTGTCTVSPPLAVDPVTGTGFVEVTFDGTGDPDMPWELQTADGVAVPLPLRVDVGDEPVVLRVATSTVLENKEYIGGGLFTLRTEWSRHPAGEDGPDYSQEATSAYEVELIPRSNPGWALIITLIVTALAMLVSLGLLRLMNHVLVRIPEPGAFYFRVVPVKISPDPVLGATWFPTGDGFASSSRPVGADSPGRDLKAGPLRVHRSLSPVWKPFSSPFSRLKGDRVIRSTPSGRRAGTAPVAFPSLTALMASGDERSTDGSFAGQIVVLYPRRHEFDEMQVRQDVDRLVGQIGEDLGRLTPESSDVVHDNSNESGSRAPGRSASEPTSRGSGSSAPPTRSGSTPGLARDTTTPDREPPRREPPRREPPPRRR